MKEKLIYAKDCKCCKCGKQAEVFWPMIDPDIPHYPYCRECVEKAKIKVLIEINKTNEKHDHNHKRKNR